MLNRGDYWQCAFVIPKAFAELRGRGLEAFREDIIASTVPFLSDRVGELRTWDDVKLLTVIVDRLRRWYARAAVYQRRGARDVADQRRD